MLPQRRTAVTTNARRTLAKRMTAAMFAFLVAALSPLTSAAQQAQSAPDFLPKTTAVYVHVKDPAALTETIQNHPILNYVLEMKEVQQRMRSPQFAMAMLGRGLLEQQIGEDVIESFKKHTAHGIWVAVDTETNGVMLLFQSKDENELKKTAGKVLKFIASMAAQNGNEAPFKKVDYRDAVAAEFDGLLIARYKTWFMLTNKPKLAKSVVDNMIDGADASLAQQDWFKQAFAQQRSEADVWAAVDLATIRKIAKNQEAFLGRTDNPGIELMFGGVLDALKNAPVALGELNLNEHLDFSLSAPFDAKWANASREFFFGKNLGGYAPKALNPKNMIANLTSYRDVGLWWLSKEELYGENVIAQLAQVDSQLSTIFSGMDFGEDVLGCLEPGVQIIVTENQYDDKYIPDIKIPAFALVGTLKDPDKIRRKLKIAFQSVVGFANINLGMNGQPQLEVETENIGDTKIASAEYYYEDGTEEGLLLFNFAPTIAFQGSHLILSSKRELAVELAELIAKGEKKAVEAKNTRLKIDGQMLHKILMDNRESLIAQNMLNEGNDRKAAESQIEILFEIADLFKDASLDYGVTNQEMSVDFRLRFDDVDSIKTSSAK